MTPGACQSDFDRESTGIERILRSIVVKILARTTEAGSRTLVAGVAAGEETHGSYMADSKIAQYEIAPCLYPELRNSHADIVVRPGPMVLGSDGLTLQKKVWDQLVRELEIIEPGISHNI
jgi:retinol dehydrogenase-12